LSQADLSKSMRPYLKKKSQAEVTECLPSKQEDLGSNPSDEKKGGGGEERMVPCMATKNSLITCLVQ
jgi:hypothetical protein